MKITALFIALTFVASSAFAKQPNATQRLTWQPQQKVDVNITDRVGTPLTSSEATNVITAVPAKAALAGDLGILSPWLTPQPEVLVGPETVTLTFTTNSSTLTAKEKLKLKKFLQRLDDEDYNKIVVTGWADTRGAKSYNSKLSKSRASTVTELLRKYGLKKNSLKAQGAGELEAASLIEARKVEVRVIR